MSRMSTEEKIEKIIEILDHLVNSDLNENSLRQYLNGCIEELRAKDVVDTFFYRMI